MEEKIKNLLFGAARRLYLVDQRELGIMITVEELKVDQISVV
jgi:hypothetical protein